MQPSLLLVLCWLASPPPPPSFDPGAVGQAIAERRQRVAELRLIKEAAEELGVRVWLFGGTAAGFAHYVRWDLAREAGDQRYRESFFDYDFTNIYRSTQDADLVVDGTPEQAARLESLIKEKMAFLQGSKEHWEVRLLREDRTTGSGQVKQALLKNPDFLDQNTDSNSTGMIELTDPPPGEAVVRDLRDWDDPQPFFLRDVSEGRLHYYQSPRHRQTSRYRAGHNPEIFSVIRYLVKAFQYHLAVDREDLVAVKAIVDAFEPARDYPDLSEWARGWLERYGPNLIRHALDVEYAWNTLEELGLREKLIALSRPSEPASLGGWLSREPLRTVPLGLGPGKTAAELGIEVVAHETISFLAYESITRDTTLRPNLLISRPNHPGEAAACGPGFYTLLGRSGARGTGFTIRFRVAPDAREGQDFTVHGSQVVFTNRAALQVIPESLKVSFPDYLALLGSEQLGHSDRGAWMKLQRRLRLQPLSPGDEERAVEIVSRAIEESGPSLPEALVSEWLSHPLSRAHPEVLDQLADAAGRALDVYQRSGSPHWLYLNPFLMAWLKDPASRSYPELNDRVAGLVGRDIRRIAGPGLQPGLSNYRQRMHLPNHQMQALVHVEELIRQWFSLRVSTEHPELVELLIDEGFDGDWLLQQVFDRRAEWADRPELLRALMRKRQIDPALLVGLVLYKPEWGRHRELFQSLLNLPGHPVDEAVASVLRRPEPTGWDEPALVRDLLGRHSALPGADPKEWEASHGRVIEYLATALEQARWSEHPGLVQALLEGLPQTCPPILGPRIAAQIRELLRAPQWADQPGLVLAWLKSTDASWDEGIEPLFQAEPWRSNPLLRDLCGDGPVEVGCLRASLPGPSAHGEEDLARRVIQSPVLSPPEEACQ